MRSGFRMLLDAEDDIEVVGEAANGAEAVERARATRPDVVLMDIRMPELDGIKATGRSPDPRARTVRVLILTTYDTDEYVFEALQAGASGFLLKDAGPAELLHAIRVVAAGEALLAPRITRRLIAQFTAGERRHPGRRGPAGGPDPARTRGPVPGRSGPQQRRDRRGAVPQPRHRPHPRQPRHGQARRPRPRPTRRHRLPDRPGHPPAVSGVAASSHLPRGAGVRAADYWRCATSRSRSVSRYDAARTPPTLCT